MQPLLQPRQPDPSSPDAIQPLPPATIPAGFDSKQVADDLAALVQSEDLAAVADDNVRNLYKDGAADVKEAQEASAFSEAEQDKKTRRLRGVLSKLAARTAAFVGAVSKAVAAPTLVIVLTNAEAGARVLALAQKLLDQLRRLFFSDQ